MIEIEESETFELGPEDEAELLTAIAQADRGEMIGAEEFLAELAKRTRRRGS